MLQFLDRCDVCGNTIAQIIKFSGSKKKIIVRKKNKQALALLKRYIDCPTECKILSGTYANSLIYYNNRGTIFDFNNYKIGKNEDFIQSTLKVR